MVKWKDPLKWQYGRGCGIGGVKDLPNLIAPVTMYYSLSTWRNIETLLEDLLTLLIQQFAISFHTVTAHRYLASVEQQKLCLSEHGTDDLRRLWLVVP